MCDPGLILGTYGIPAEQGWVQSTLQGMLLNVEMHERGRNACMTVKVAKMQKKIKYMCQGRSQNVNGHLAQTKTATAIIALANLGLYRS